ncbi:trypsin-like peptidase domain-containing protein [Candidatus Woesearchaeota archaeon]|nr:trypsin-like peptidase domain-containing protein [Candidatus Woesearchaeota archaeon]
MKRNLLSSEFPWPFAAPAATAVVVGALVFGLAWYFLSSQQVPSRLVRQPNVSNARCYDKSDTQRLEHILKLQKAFAAESEVKSSDQLESFASNTVVVKNPFFNELSEEDLPESLRRIADGRFSIKTSESALAGLYLGKGYVLTANHGVTEILPSLQNVQIQVEYFFKNPVSESWEKFSGPISDVSAIPRRDLALLYVPYLAEASLKGLPIAVPPPQLDGPPRIFFDVQILPSGASLRFRPQNTLKEGEAVYLITYDPRTYWDMVGAEPDRRITILEGAVTSLSAPQQTRYSDQFQTSIPVIRGQSGSPLVDKNGNIVGLLSQLSQSASGTSKSYFTSIDGLAELLELERNRLESCPSNRVMTKQ